MPHIVPIATPLLGWLMGALIPIEPDHLCSLIALNAGKKQVWPAMVTGMQWGLGHSVGMLLFCAVFLPLQSIINKDVWEHYGNYIAGMLLVAIGVYFLVNEAKYLEKQDDGSWLPKEDACACCPGPPLPISLTSAYSRNHSHDHAHGESCGHECDPEVPPVPETTPLLSDGKASHALEASSPLDRWAVVRNSLIGLLQGMCCPSCMAGMAFVGQMGAQHPSKFDVASFFAIVFASIVLSSALISVCLVLLGKGVNSHLGVSTRSLYWAACIVSVVLGSAWIVLNAGGHLDVLEYTHGINMKLHNLAQGRGNQLVQGSAESWIHSHH